MLNAVFIASHYKKISGSPDYNLHFLKNPFSIIHIPRENAFGVLKRVIVLVIMG